MESMHPKDVPIKINPDDGNPEKDGWRRTEI